MNNDLIEIEKVYFSNTHRNFDRLIKNLKNKKNISNENLKKLIILNKKMLEINNLLEEVNYNIDKKKNKCSINIDKELENYEKNDKAISSFLPYIMYYRFLMESE